MSKFELVSGLPMIGLPLSELEVMRKVCIQQITTFGIHGTKRSVSEDLVLISEWKERLYVVEERMMEITKNRFKIV